MKGGSRSKGGALKQEMSGRAREISSSPSSSLLSPRSSSSSSQDDGEEHGSPLRPVFCLKRKDADIKELDDKYDCFILDFDDPLDSLQGITKLSISSSGSPEEDVSLIAEKGQVACRDYPHSRHLCVIYPFDKMPHESYCKMCYCYVCDMAAPCKYWTDEYSAHCHASEHAGDWKNQRMNLRKNEVDQSPPESS